MGDQVTVRILRGDVLAMLATLPDESVHCCVTSPPYYGLRDYGVAGQLGLEPTLAEYVEKMVAVFREVRRVLRSDGTLWLNIGDSYQSKACGQVADSMRGIGSKHDFLGATAVGPPLQDGMKPKDLMMVPERISLALQADGWWVRSRIIWNKKSCMPESVRDRPTKAHEHIWLLTKSERYYYDSEAASEPVEGTERDQAEMRRARSTEDQKSVPDAERNGIRPVKRSGNKERKPASARGVPVDTDGGTNGAVAGSIPWEGSTRNWRDVWSLGPEPFKDAHFATFPTEIPRRAIVAGCPVGGTVLDPFLGSGTTALVADRLQRNAIGIELNPAYADMAEKRIRGDSPLFAEVA